MKKDQILKTEENNNLVKIETERDNIWKQFPIAMNCLMFQDQNGIEKSLYLAQLSYDFILKKSNDDDDNRIEKCILLYIETVSKFLKGNLYQFDQNFKKSYDEYISGKKLSDEGVLLSEMLLNELENSDDPDTYNLINTCNFMFQYFSYVLYILSGICIKYAERIDGKFIDEVKLLKIAAEEFKNFKFSGQININEANKELVTGLKGQLNQFSEIYEKLADKIIEKRKTTEFIIPYEKKVFIIHGHDEARLLELEGILKEFNLKPVILKNENDNGKTVIEKLEDYGKDCAFAFAIITPDDIAYNKDKKIFQARPNVLYELGWFMGRYGRSKVRLLCKTGTSLPSDLLGIVNIEFNEKLEEVYRKIRVDLENIGILESNKN